MNLIKCEKLEKSMAELQFSIDAETYKAEVLKVFKTEGKKYTVQGFRKGKAPLQIIRKEFADGLNQEIQRAMFQKNYPEAI